MVTNAPSAPAAAALIWAVPLGVLYPDDVSNVTVRKGHRFVQTVVTVAIFVLAVRLWFP
jgi:ABC-type proline/glycine betaine transport system permease subunit